MANKFLDSLCAALENQEPTDDILKKASGAGNPDLATQREANDPDGNAGSPGDSDGTAVGQVDPDRNPDETDLDAQKDSSLENADHVRPVGDAQGNPAPASEADGFPDTTAGLQAEVNLHKNRNLIPLQQEKDARDPSGHTDDPADNKQTPVSPSGDSKAATLDKAVQDSYDRSGNTGDPSSVNGTPVSKSGDSRPLAKNQFEKAADDDSGNPDSPGVNGDPAPSFESFITACEQMMTVKRPGTVTLPQSMSLESYAMELGMGEIAARALESTLTAAERRNLKDSDFGLPEQRKWPLNDESHVRSAIQNFHWCPKENQRELAKNILKAMHKYGMKNVEVSEGNPFAAYYPDAKIVPRKKPERKAAATTA
jgi:hypothetical protein